MSAPASKRCSKCREEKPLGDFHRQAAKPDGRRSACKACLRDGDRERARRWRENNPEKKRALNAARDPEKLRELSHRVRARLAARSPEEVAAKQAEMWPDGLRPCRRGCGELLPLDAFGRTAAELDGLSRACLRCGAATVAARKYATHAPSWDERGLYGCYLCGAPFEHADHKHPKALGGVDDVENLAPACAACNLSKSDTPLEEFRPDLFALVASWPVEIRLVNGA